MNQQLKCSIGQYSHQGLKATNQDSHGVAVPNEPHLSTKGIAIAIADGISSSDVSQIASQASVRSFLEDYYCTSETWTVKTAAQRVLLANNSWLFAQNHRNHEFRLNKDKGYVCTFTALVLKSNTAYVLHVGDTQITRFRNTDTSTAIDVLTEQHRLCLSGNKSYLARALGITQQLNIDYAELPLQIGDTFLLATDGVYEYVTNEFVQRVIEQHANDLDLAAQKISEQALEQGSDDNVTAQIVRIDSLPSGKADEFLLRLNDLPMPPELSARMVFDGYQIIRDLHKSSRSHVVLAQDVESQQQVVIKLPSTQGRANPDYMERFLMEEWIANRINNAHVLKPHKIGINNKRQRKFCYVVTEFVDGITLAQWMVDNPSPSLEQVRSIIEQVAKGLQAFHRQEMLHQDIRPHNIMMDAAGTAKIIDFGSAFVSGIDETHTYQTPQAMPGTAQFIAPEYFLGEYGTKRSDLYSLACLAYHMLCGKSPYGTAVARATSRAAQHKLVYRSILNDQRQLPVWLDLTLKKALQPDPTKRYAELSEFVQDLRKPNTKFLNQSQPPLLARDPVRFWQGVSAVLLSVIVYLASR